MKKLLYSLVFFVSVCTYSQKKTEIFESELLESQRQFSVILPPSYNTTKDRTYPVIYVLDGEYLLDPFNGTLQYGYYFDDLPEVILVGIHQENTRTIDSKANDEGIPSEKSAKFFEFLTLEIIPFIDKNYRTTNYKAIAGHDATAGFLNFFLYKDNPVFNGYISLSPEFAFDMENRISDRLNIITKPISYFQVSSSSDDKAIFEKVQLLDQKLKTISSATLSYKYIEINGFSHYSMVPIAIPQALYHLFKGYQPISKDEYKELQKLDSGFVDFLSEKYKKINANYGANLKIRLMDFLLIKNLIFISKAPDELMNLEKLASKEYPKTKLSYYIESAYFEKIGNIDKAIKALEKSYSAKEIGMLTKSFLLEEIDRLRRL